MLEHNLYALAAHSEYVISDAMPPARDALRTMPPSRDPASTRALVDRSRPRCAPGSGHPVRDGTLGGCRLGTGG